MLFDRVQRWDRCHGDGRDLRVWTCGSLRGHRCMSQRERTRASAVCSGPRGSFVRRGLCLRGRMPQIDRNVKLFSVDAKAA